MYLSQKRVYIGKKSYLFQKNALLLPGISLYTHKDAAKEREKKKEREEDARRTTKFNITNDVMWSSFLILSRVVLSFIYAAQCAFSLWKGDDILVFRVYMKP